MLNSVVVIFVVAVLLTASAAYRSPSSLGVCGELQSWWHSSSRHRQNIKAHNEDQPLQSEHHSIRHEAVRLATDNFCARPCPGSIAKPLDPRVIRRYHDHQSRRLHRLPKSCVSQPLYSREETEFNAVRYTG